MKNLAFGLFVFCISTFTVAETSVSVNDVSGCTPLSPAEMAKFVSALEANDAAERSLPPICDSFGFVWILEVQRGQIRGIAEICGTFPVEGQVRGGQFSMTANITGNQCYCNDFHQFDGTVDKPNRRLIGTAYAFGGCEGEAPCEAGLCN